MKREDVDEKYKWDIALVLPNENAFNVALEEIRLKITEVKSFEGVLNTPEKIFEYFNFETGVSQLISRVYLYAFLNKSKDMSNAISQKNYQLVEGLADQFYVASSFAMPELTSVNTELLQNMKCDKKFADYDRVLETIIKGKPHVLTTAEEKILNGVSNCVNFSEVYTVLNDVELKFEPVITETGEKRKLTHSTYGVLLRSKNEKVRRQAQQNMCKKYCEFNLTLSQNYINLIKYLNFVAKTKHFDSLFQQSFFDEEIDEKVYYALVQAVHKALPIYYDYIETKRKKLGQKKISAWDMLVSTADEAKLKFTYEEGMELVKSALSILGQDYVNLIARAQNERWIDVYATDNKESGAYSVSCSTGNPFILLNYEKTFNDVSTIAHEIGHSIHSYFSETNQPYTKHDYVTFIAEIASTVNELLLNQYMLKHNNDKNLHKFIIENMMQEFCSAVFNQTKYGEFEYEINKLVEQDKPVTFETINNTFDELQKLYLGAKTNRNKYDKYAWSRISHFYRPFYVYKYATGFLSAVIISEKILSEGSKYVEKYKKMLSAGCSADPVTILKMADVDISDINFLNKGFEFFEKLLIEYKQD